MLKMVALILPLTPFLKLKRPTMTPWELLTIAKEARLTMSQVEKTTIGRMRVGDQMIQKVLEPSLNHREVTIVLNMQCCG
jgi:hypothetical protein